MQARKLPASTGGLVQSMDRAHAAMCAASAELLAAIPELEDSGVWRTDGANCMSAWLAARYGVTRRTAGRWVRVARALRELPAIAEELARGRLGFDKVEPLVRFAAPETERELARWARGVSAGWIWREAERRRRIEREEVEEVRRARRLDLVWEPGATALHVSGMLPPEQGAVLERALTHRAQVLEVEPDVEDPRAARLADALVHLVTEGGTGRRPRPVLVVHADAEVLTGESEDSLAETASGIRLTPEAVRRIAGEARIEWVVEVAGRPVGVGRRRRSPPGWLERLVEFRDGGRCRFPGCERDWWTIAHHIRWWSAGGPTDLDNLITLCWFHHQLIHEEGWTIRGHPHERVWFEPPPMPG